MDTQLEDPAPAAPPAAPPAASWMTEAEARKILHAIFQVDDLDLEEQP